MPRYVAFLRAINVGGHIVKMDRLRALFEELGLSQVETFIASGNVLFNSPSKSGAALERKIEKHLRASLGYEVATFIRTPAEVQQAAAYEPFAAAVMARPYHGLYVSFLRDAPPAAARRAVEALSGANDDFHIHERELYWLSRVPFGESKVAGPSIDRILGMPGDDAQRHEPAEARRQVRGRAAGDRAGVDGRRFRHHEQRGRGRRRIGRAAARHVSLGWRPAADLSVRPLLRAAVAVGRRIGGDRTLSRLGDEGALHPVAEGVPRRHARSRGRRSGRSTTRWRS